MVDYSKLSDNCVVHARCGRAGATGVVWEAPKTYTLYVQKDPKGAIFAIEIVDRNFAEFDPRHDLDEGVLVSKDYYFEVLGIVEQSI